VTNHHVIAGAPKEKSYPEAKVVFDSGADGEKEVAASVVAMAPIVDLALLRVLTRRYIPCRHSGRHVDRVDTVRVLGKFAVKLK
jgi:S1-C subfamily serine protease